MKKESATIEHEKGKFRGSFNNIAVNPEIEYVQPKAQRLTFKR